MLYIAGMERHLQISGVSFDVSFQRVGNDAQRQILGVISADDIVVLADSATAGHLWAGGSDSGTAMQPEEKCWACVGGGWQGDGVDTARRHTPGAPNIQRSP